MHDLNRIVTRGVLVLVLSVFVIMTANAQTPAFHSLGTIHSPQGIGFVYSRDRVDQDWFTSYNATADMLGVLAGEHSSPGVKFTYNHNVIFRDWLLRDTRIELYGGPGLSIGYLRDREKPFGGMAGLNCTAGLRTRLDGPINLALEFNTDIAFYINKNPRYGTLQLSMYESGVNRILFPHIKIYYCL